MVSVEYELRINKHRMYCDAVHICRNYILQYISKKGIDCATLAKAIHLSHNKLLIVKVERGIDLNSNTPYAKLYGNDGEDYILYELGVSNLLKMINTFKMLNKC